MEERETTYHEVILGTKVDGVRLITAFLSVKRIILTNWKVPKPNCFWIKDLIMEGVASELQDLYKDGLDGPWTLIRKHISERNAVQE